MSQGTDDIGASYEQAVRVLTDSLKFGIHPSLDGIRAMMHKMGNPHRDYRCIQVAGTNGKSSTVRQIAALLQAHGLRTGLYTSPHLVEYRERMEIDGQVASHQLFAQGVMLAKQTADQLTDMTITEFELLTAAAFWMFSQAGVDVVVLECGMGGRWDSTSIVDAQVAVVTGIGLDHLGILGDTIEQIAAEKAAIIHGGATVLGPGTQSTLPVFLQRCEHTGATPWLVRDAQTACEMRGAGTGDSIGGTPIAGFVSYRGGYAQAPNSIEVDIEGIHGAYEGICMESPLYQAQNISTAIAAAECFLGCALEPVKVREVLGGFSVPGRFETLRENPFLIIDAAHNPQSALNLATAIANKFPEGDFLLLLAVLADKDAQGIIGALAGLTPDVAVTQTSSSRALPCGELADMVEQLTGTRPEVFATPSAALDDLLQRGVNIIASGSITLAGEVKAAWNQLQSEQRGSALL